MSAAVKVLVIDDSNTIRRSAEAFLRQAGFNVVLAEDGFDAVELIKPWRIATPVLHIDALQNTDQIYASDVECVGDVGAVLDWLRESWSGQPRWGTKDVAAHRTRLENARLSAVVGAQDEGGRCGGEADIRR